MKRRTMLVGLGGLAGAGGLVGTGAFTSVSAIRGVTVDVAEDSNTLLAMAPSSGPNGEFASGSGGTIALDFTDSGEGSSGVGTDSVYEFDDVFTITNQGTQQVYVWTALSGGSGNLTPTGSDADLWFYPDGDSDTKLHENGGTVLELGVGETAQVGVHIDTHAVTQDQNLTTTVHATVEQPSGTTPGGPTTQRVLVAESGGNYPSVSEAMDSEDIEQLDVIEIDSGTYDDVDDDDTASEIIELRDPSGLQIVGQGSGSTTINNSFELDITKPSGNGFTLSGVQLAGNNYEPADDYEKDHGIEITGSGVSELENITFDDVTVTGYTSDQIQIGTGVRNLELLNSTLLEGSLPATGISVSGRVSASRIYNTRIDVSQDGILFTDIENVTIENCRVTTAQPSSAFEVANASPTPGAQSTVTECRLESGNRTISIQGGRANLLIEKSDVIFYDLYGVKYGPSGVKGDVRVVDSFIYTNSVGDPEKVSDNVEIVSRRTLSEGGHPNAGLNP